MFSNSQISIAQFMFVFLPSPIGYSVLPTHTWTHKGSTQKSLSFILSLYGRPVSCGGVWRGSEGQDSFPLIQQTQTHSPSHTHTNTFSITSISRWPGQQLCIWPLLTRTQCRKIINFPSPLCNPSHNAACKHDCGV